MKLTSIRLAAVAVLALCAPALAAEEMVDNPAYKAWASYKPGTSVTTESTIEFGAIEGAPEGMPAGFKMPKQTHTSTVTLKEVTAEKAVIETTMNSARAPLGAAIKPMKTDIPAKIEKSKVDFAMVQKENVTVTNVKDGKDKVEIKSKKHDTTTKDMDVEMKEKEGTGKGHIKLWTVDAIPGGVAKMVMELKMEQKGEPDAPAMKIPMTITSVVTDYEIK